MATAVGHRIGRDEIIWAFGPELEPVLEIDPGETVTFETNDCFTGQITSEDDLVTEIDFEWVNSATGPVAVRGAEPGDSLVAEIVDVRRRHGGNLDDHLHGNGARIYFPVRQAGGMFAVGDMHASMGDGEICFTGVEIAGEVDIRFDLLKGKQATWPVTELENQWVPHATANDYDHALKLCSRRRRASSSNEWGFSLEDAFIFLSVACDAGVAQACKPAPGFGTIARFTIPKLDATPSPRRTR
jgi:acetamidase/formamidase